MKVSLKALRVNAEMTQKEASAAIGITEKTLQNWESNVTYPTYANLVRICEVYQCGLGDIFLPTNLAKSER